MRNREKLNMYNLTHSSKWQMIQHTYITMYIYILYSFNSVKAKTCVRRMKAQRIKNTANSWTNANNTMYRMKKKKPKAKTKL